MTCNCSSTQCSCGWTAQFRAPAYCDNCNLKLSGISYFVKIGHKKARLLCNSCCEILAISCAMMPAGGSGYQAQKLMTQLQKEP